MRLSCLLTLAALPALSGCLPALTHGARIEPGAALGSTLSGHVLSRQDSTGARSTAPGFDGGLYLTGAAVPSSWHGAGLRATVQAGLASGVGFDAYAQAPHMIPRVALGAGVLYQPVRRNVVMPYLMAGRTLGDGTEIFLTAGIANGRGTSDASVRRTLGIASIGIRTPTVNRILRRAPQFLAYVMVVGGNFPDQYDPDPGMFGIHAVGTSRVIIGMAFDLRNTVRRRCTGPPSGDPNTGRCRPTVTDPEPSRPRIPPRGLPPRPVPRPPSPR